MERAKRYISKDLVFIAASIFLILAFIKVHLLLGIAVNAILYIIAWLFGVKKALFFGLFPSLLLFTFGLLPNFFAPLIPFIILGNAILILSFSQKAKTSYFAAIFLSATLKAIFLGLVFLLLLKEVKLAFGFALFQGVSALTGGLISSVLKR